MLNSHLIIHLLFSAAQLLSGILANSIILVGIGMDLIKTRTWTSLSLLLSCLAIFRICLQVLFFYTTLLLLSLTEISLLSGYFAVCMVVNDSGLWCATWLGVFYCAKIAVIAHPLFRWLKKSISKLVPWLMLISLFYSSMISVGHSQYTWPISKNIMLQYLSRNVTTLSTEISAFPYIFLAMGLGLPLLIFLFAVLLLVVSLWRHSRKMSRMVDRTQDLTRCSYLSSMSSILSFLLLYLSHYVAGFLIASQILPSGRLTFLVCIFIAGTYPSAHSIILILGNTKLKQNAKLFLLHGRCCL